MKKYIWFVVIAAVLIVVVYNIKKIEDNRLEAQFNSQLENNWNQVIGALDLMRKRTDNVTTLRNYADNEYKLVSVIKFDVNSACESQAREFTNGFAYEAATLFDQLSDPITKEKVPVILATAKRVDDKAMDIYGRNPDFRKPVMVSDLLRNRLASLVPKEVTKIVVVNNYPSYVSTPEQRQSYSNMQDIARRYFAARTDLGRRINWNRAKVDQNYLCQSGIRSILLDAINLRIGLQSELSQAAQIEGMSDLGNSVDRMISNSLQSLTILRDQADYPAFKRINNENDAISKRIRRTFGI